VRSSPWRYEESEGAGRLVLVAWGGGLEVLSESLSGFGQPVVVVVMSVPFSLEARMWGLFRPLRMKSYTLWVGRWASPSRWFPPVGNRLEDLAPFRGSLGVGLTRHRAWLKANRRCGCSAWRPVRQWPCWSAKVGHNKTLSVGLCPGVLELPQRGSCASPSGDFHLLRIGQYGLHVTSLPRSSKMSESPQRDEGDPRGNLNEDIRSFML
jgi:hypothetical protein